MFNIRDYVMPARPQWNSLGPRLPPWFRLALRRVDPRLVLQFMPPQTIDERGVSPILFPLGVWVVCHRMRGSGWLHKKWVYQLADPHGRPLQPGRDQIELLRLARNIQRRGKADRLDQEFDQAIQAMRRARERQAKQRAMEAVVATCRRHDIAQFAGRRVRMPG
ncbi:MAG: hypothetical protein ACYSVY_12705 [Planctomycetota bacterium]|jgi:hypothetical protein